MTRISATIRRLPFECPLGPVISKAGNSHLPTRGIWATVANKVAIPPAINIVVVVNLSNLPNPTRIDEKVMRNTIRLKVRLPIGDLNHPHFGDPRPISSASAENQLRVHSGLSERTSNVAPKKCFGCNRIIANGSAYGRSGSTKLSANSSTRRRSILFSTSSTSPSSTSDPSSREADPLSSLATTRRSAFFGWSCRASSSTAARRRSEATSPAQARQ